MPNWTLEIDFSIFKDISPQVAAVVMAAGPDNFTNYRNAAESVSENAEILYKDYLQGHPMPNGKSIRKPAKEVAEGVVRKATGHLEWDLMNTVDAAKGIEEGFPEYDMKTGLPKYKKTRQAKDGSLYLIVPFRHGNPNSTTMNPMPKAIYKIAKQLEYSYQLGLKKDQPYRLSATGHMVENYAYQWGGRLTNRQIGLVGGDLNETKRYSGMYRFNGPKHSEFITFRTMSQKSSGWIRPATPGFFPLKTAIEVAMEQGAASLGAALQADFVAMITK